MEVSDCLLHFQGLPATRRSEMTLDNYTRVRLLTNRYQNEGVYHGTIGYIIEMYEHEYEIEFSDSQGITIAQVVVQHHEVTSAEANVLNFTAIFVETPDGGYIGLIEELPGIDTSGSTLDECRINLQKKVRMLIQTSRERINQRLAGKHVFRESFALTMN